MHDKTPIANEPPWPQYHWRYFAPETNNAWDFRWQQKTYKYKYRCHWCKDIEYIEKGVDSFCPKETCQILNELVRGEQVGQQS